MPTEDQIARAAAILNEGKKIVDHGRAGRARRRAEVEAIAERLGAPVVKPLLGKGVLPDDSPYTTGGTGLLGTRRRRRRWKSCDTLLMVGSSFPYIEFYPEARPGQVRPDRARPKRIGLRCPVEAALVGDCRRALRALLPRLDHTRTASFLETAQAGMQEWRELMQERGTRTDMPMKPQVVAHELNKLLSDDAIIAADSGTITTWVGAPHRHARQHDVLAAPATWPPWRAGCPTPTPPQIAYPGRQVVAFVGDGGFTMLMGELATAVKYDLDVKIIVIKNNTLGQIKWEQMVFLGNPGIRLRAAADRLRDRRQRLRRDRLHHRGPGDLRRDPAAGARHARARADRGGGRSERAADAAEGSRVKQAAKFAESLARGTPNAGKIALTIASDKVREII